jgi:hypothetical protein
MHRCDGLPHPSVDYALKSDEFESGKVFMGGEFSRTTTGMSLASIATPGGW